MCPSLPKLTERGLTSLQTWTRKQSRVRKYLSTIFGMKISQFWCSAGCRYSVQVCRRHWGHPQAACTRPVQHDQDGGSIWSSPWDSWQDCWGCSTLLPGCTDRLGSYPPYYHSHHAGSLSAPCSPSQADQLRICWWEREVRQLWVVVRIM